MASPALNNGIQFKRPTYMWLKKAAGLTVGIPGVTAVKWKPELITAEQKNAILPQANTLKHNIGKEIGGISVTMSGLTATALANILGLTQGTKLPKIYIEELTVAAGAVSLEAEPMESPADGDNAMAIAVQAKDQNGAWYEKVEAGDTPGQGEFSADGTDVTFDTGDNDQNVRVIYMTEADDGGGSLTLPGNQPVIAPMEAWIGGLAYLLENGPGPTNVDLSSGAGAGMVYAKYLTPVEIGDLLNVEDETALVEIGFWINIIEPSTDWRVSMPVATPASTGA